MWVLRCTRTCLSSAAGHNGHGQVCVFFVLSALGGPQLELLVLLVSDEVSAAQQVTVVMLRSGCFECCMGRKWPQLTPLESECFEHCVWPQWSTSRVLGVALGVRRSLQHS
eukprot:scaffold9128_cov23-Tisochrysis_lutea.AAC.4